MLTFKKWVEGKIPNHNKYLKLITESECKLKSAKYKNVYYVLSKLSPPVTPEDIVADAFLRMAEYHQKPENKSAMHSEEEFNAFFWRHHNFAYKTKLEEASTQKRKTNGPTLDIDDPITVKILDGKLHPYISITSHRNANEIYEEFLKTLPHDPPQLKQVAELLDKYTQREISNLTNISETMVHRITKKLESLFKDYQSKYF